MKKTNKSAGVQYKLIFYYALFALLPMFLIAVFTYGNTKKIQLERLYEELSYQMEHTIKNLDEKANSYYAVSNMFYMDNTLQSYLTADYSQRGYEDLYSYVDDLFSNVKTFNPDITKISVYTSNRTLPQDEYYFYLLDPENLPDWYQTTGNGGVMHMQNTGNGTISFTRKLNFYESGQYQIFVYMEITEDYLNQMLGLGDEEITMVLLNDAGEIQASNHPELIGKNMASINLEKQLFMKNNTAYCGQLQLFTDSRRYDKEAGLAASRAILYLSDFYRITLSKGKQDITIREELNLLESYLKIQRMRFDDSIEVEYELDESLLDVHVVKLTLQPIVENAIHHGRDDDSEVFHILIRLFEEQGKTVFEVIDDGCGMDPEKLMELQNSMNRSEGGYGLRNVNIRIKLQYGSQYGVYIESERGFGTKIRIEFPGGERAKA